MTRALPSDYARPYRPLTARLAERVAPSGPLELEALLATALRRARAPSFADPSFLPALEILLDSMNAEARLNGVGRWLQRERLIGNLVNRRRLEPLLPTEAEAEATPLPPLVVIAGLQRSGTTLLQRLLAAAPGARSLPSWEALNPAPLPDEGPTPRRRRRTAWWARQVVRHLAPEFFAIHPIEIDEPEEEVLLADLTFESQTAEALLHVPTYAAWVEARDAEPVYRYLRRVLHLLGRARPHTHWVLKSPMHLDHLEVLARTFPEAIIVQTHRDPRRTVPSFASLVARSRGLFSDHVSPADIGAQWSGRIERMVRRALAARDRLPEARFVDVDYAALVADPVGAAAVVHERAGLPWDAGTAAALAAARERNRRGRYGRHRYHLADFALDEASLRERFAGYAERFLAPAAAEAE